MSDVRLSTANWIKLKTKPLFFVRDALTVYDDYNFNVSKLVDTAKKVFEDRPDGEKLGRGSVENVLRLKPVVHRTARRFIRVLNAAVEAKGGEPSLEESQVIAAVFYIFNARNIMDALNVSSYTVASQAGLSEGLVENVRRGGRVHLAAARKLVAAFEALARENGIDEGSQIGRLVFGEPQKLILEDTNGVMVVHSDERGECLIREQDLELAPSNGHPWALI